MKFYFQHNEDGRVTSYSLQKNTTTQSQVLLDVGDEEINVMKQNYELWIKNGELICVMPERLKNIEIAEEKARIAEAAKKDLAMLMSNPNTKLIDIKDILLKLIN